jgi:hypothetical protein
MRVGGALGTALFAVLLQHELTGAADPAAVAHAYGVTFWWNLGATALVALAALALPRDPAPARAPEAAAGVPAPEAAAAAEPAAV